MKCATTRIPALKRTLLFLSILCFLLPFVSVKSCNSHTVTNYTGLELLLCSGGWVYAVSIGLSLFLLAMTFVRVTFPPVVTGFFHAGASVLSALAFTIIVLYPELQFLFDDVVPRAGQVIGGLSWTLLYVVSGISAVNIIRSIRRTTRAAGDMRHVNRPWEIVFFTSALILLLLPYAGLLKEPEGTKIIASFLVMLFFSSPLIVMLYFLRIAVIEGRRWGKVLAVAWFAVLAVFASAGTYLTLVH